MDHPEDLKAAGLEPMLVTEDLEHLLRYSDRTLRRMVAEGRLPKPIKMSGRNRWRMADVRAYLAAL